MENKNEVFEYTYSATQQEEIEKIRAKYLPREDSKLETLRKLDASVTKKATTWGITIGIIGCLLFGGGMSMILVGTIALFVPGILLGCFGMAVMAVAYPVYKKVLEKERARIAPKILALTEELGG